MNVGMNTRRSNSMRLLSAYLVYILSLGLGWAQAASSNAPISFIGQFSNVRPTQEHAYGYSVELWQSGTEIVGLLSSSYGLSGDTPTGQLQNIHFDPANGALSFTAKLTIASLSLGPGKTEPSHDLFKFSGTLRNGKLLIGSISHADLLDPNHKPSIEPVRLARTQEPPDINAKTIDQWQQAVDRILNFRGPKW